MRTVQPGARGRAAWLLAYVVLAVADVAAELVDARLATRLLPLTLMPTLAAYFVRSVPRSRTAVLVVVALGAAWLGDCLPGGAVVLIGCFAVTQIAYTVTFARHWRRSLVARPPALVAYAVVMVPLIAFVATRSGQLAFAVAGYGLLVAIMVALATGVSRRCAAGAGIFLVSDTTLGCSLFLGSTHSPVRSAVIMFTYLLAQLLIVTGLVARLGSRRVGPSAPAGLFAARS